MLRTVGFVAGGLAWVACYCFWAMMTSPISSPVIPDRWERLPLSSNVIDCTRPCGRWDPDAVIITVLSDFAGRR